MVPESSTWDGVSVASGGPHTPRPVSMLSTKGKTGATFIITGNERASGSLRASRTGALPLLGGPGIPEYIHECNRTGVIPVSYFLRHVRDNVFVMRFRGLGPLGAKALSRPLEMNAHIEILDLEGNRIGSTGALYLASSLRDNVHITSLSLPENGLQTTGACAIVEMMRENKTIKELDLSDNGLSDADGRIFYILLKHNHSMKRLSLRNNRLGGNTVDWLQEAFEHNVTLTALDLSWNHVRHRSAVILGNILEENSSLVELHLSMNGLGYEGACAMADALSKNITLELLDVSANRIITAGAFQIAKSLETNQILKTLMIGNNPITPEGALTLITAIDNNKNSAIKLLHMRAVVVTDDFEVLEKKLGQERGLKVVHGGILGGRRMMKAKFLQKKRDRLDDLELKYRSDPITKLRDYCDMRQVRLVDLFRQLDRDQSWTLSREELINGVQSTGIDMSNSEISELVRMLDKDGNGELDYQEVVFGVAANQEEKLRISHWNQEMREQEVKYKEELKLITKEN